MLEDAERKLFRILVNYYSQHRYIPDFNVLQRHTNRSKAEVIELINGLERKGYLKWKEEDENTIRDLRLPNVSKKKDKHDQQSVQRYYTEL